MNLNLNGFLSVCVVVLMFFGSCSKGDIRGVNNNSKDGKDLTSHLTEEQLKFRAECAPLHSAGLDYFISVANSSETRQSVLKANQQGDAFNVNRMITDAINDFCAQKEVASIITTQPLNSTLRSSQEMTAEEIESIFHRLYPLLLDFCETCDSNNILSCIDNYMGSEQVKSLPKDYQNALFMSLCVYEDSYGYWTDPNNMKKWDVLNTNLRSKELRSLWDDCEQFAKKAWMKVKRYAVADAKGALAFGIGGALGGAAAGVCVGGIGAVPGAVGGAVAGAISGGVGTSIYEAL